MQKRKLHSAIGIIISIGGVLIGIMMASRAYFRYDIKRQLQILSQANSDLANKNFVQATKHANLLVNTKFRDFAYLILGAQTDDPQAKGFLTILASSTADSAMRELALERLSKIQQNA